MATENLYILYTDDSTLFRATNQQFDIDALNNTLKSIQLASNE